MTVNKIRNRFAHHHEIIDFSDQKIADLCRKLDTKKPFDASDFRAKYTTYLNEVRDGKEYGGLQINQAKRLKELGKENTRLKKLVADLSLDKDILNEALRGNY